MPEAPVPEAINYNLIADMVSEKVRIPEVTMPTLDVNYDLLSEMVAEKVTVPEAPAVEIDYETISDIVAGKIVIPEEMQKYVSRCDFMLGSLLENPLACAASAYGDTVNITFSRRIEESEIELNFFQTLVRLNLPVKIETNQRY